MNNLALILSECLLTIPENGEDAEELIKFGLNRIDREDPSASSHDLTFEDVQRCEDILQQYLSRLITYNSILGNISGFNNTHLSMLHPDDWRIGICLIVRFLYISLQMAGHQDERTAISLLHFSGHFALALFWTPPSALL